MPWYPKAIRKEVTRHRTPMSAHRGVVLHVAVSESSSLFGYFNQKGNPTSHFYVRKDGTVEQYVDTQFVAPAQLDGNPTLVGIETQGGVTDAKHEQWTPAQVETLAQLCAWVHETHGTPLQAMKSSLKTERGVGPHRLGIDPWRVSGGEHWSTSYGKTCPGDAKVAQVPTVIKRAEDIVAEKFRFLVKNKAGATVVETESDDWFDRIAETIKKEVIAHRYALVLKEVVE
jgi:hypothetical protein